VSVDEVDLGKVVNIMVKKIRVGGRLFEKEPEVVA